MNEIITLLDPTAELAPARIELRPRLKTLKGANIGLLDISKARGDVLLKRLESQLMEKGAIVKFYKKPTFARTAPVELNQQIATECDAVIEALAD
ncbi:MAG: hypothetical protein GY866_27610 [Proteobacteria bacterium]|nr:hypothetical protein [Pseudomonadota bacterium]